MQGREEKDVLWRAADKLRGSVDASQYRDFVLGLVFLKYVSGASGEVGPPGGFRVPDGARWADLAARAGSAGIGARIDAAMEAVMRANPPLAGVLPRIFGRDEVDQRRLGEVGNDDIGAAVGIAVPSFYNHFAHKVDLLTTAFHHGAAVLFTDLSNATAPQPTRLTR